MTSTCKEARKDTVEERDGAHRVEAAKPKESEAKVMEDRGPDGTARQAQKGVAPEEQASSGASSANDASDDSGKSDTEAVEAQPTTQTFKFTCGVLEATKTVLLLATLAPVVGEVFGVCKEILKDVETYHKKAQKALEESGRFVLYTVEHIAKLCKLFEERVLNNGATDARAIETLQERINDLKVSVDAYKESVAKFSTVWVGLFGMRDLVDGVERAQSRVQSTLAQVKSLLELEFVELLLPPKPKSTDEPLARKLCSAVRKGDAAAVRRHLRAGANADLFIPPNSTSSKEVQATQTAAKDGRVEILRILVEEGKADPNLADANKRTALAHAVRRGKVDCVKYLVSLKGTDIDTQDIQGYTPLIAAAEDETKFEILMLLGKAGADMTKRNTVAGGSYTALEEARRSKATKNVEYLEDLDKRRKHLSTSEPVSSEQTPSTDEGDKAVSAT